jgi:hypothetical protein
MSRYENVRANELTQQASGYQVDHGVFHISQESMLFKSTSGTIEKSNAGEHNIWRKAIVEVETRVRWMAFKICI